MSAIIVERLSKRYVIGHQQRHDTFRDALSNRLTGAWSRLRRATRPAIVRENFWALRDVSFKVEPGEVVGIVGPNGAGKSTLLKILSRITEPTEGRVRLRGRVASLLEVGTGFHPELTGRENVFLNGAILGMTRVEIRRKFDEIVAFAEVERFLDTPVKRYSSGMYVRLAFAVAAHLEPDILIVDEVLAVGDASFQKKCLGKMEDAASHGRAVIFVSHDLANVTKLCRHGLLLRNGQLEYQGVMTDVVSRYYSASLGQPGNADLRQRTDRSGTGAAQFRSIEILAHAANGSTSAVTFGHPLTLCTMIDVRQSFGDAQVEISVRTSEDTAIYSLESVNEAVRWPTRPGAVRFDVTLANVALLPGDYVVDLWIGDARGTRVDYVKRALAFRVIQTPDTHLRLSSQRHEGLVFTRADWKWQQS